MFLNCADDLPEITGFDDCNPHFVFGEIEQIILGTITDDANELDNLQWDDWIDEVEGWASIIGSDSSPGEFNAYVVPVRGTLDEPDRPEVDASRYRKAFPPATFTMDCDVDDLPDEVYERLGELHNKTARLWWISGGHIFGGQKGIIAQFNTHPIIEEGEDSMHKYHVQAWWRDSVAPERKVLVTEESGT